MPRLSEATVQQVAIRYLCDHYRKKTFSGRIFAEAEVRTRKGKRADGLIAFRHWLFGTYSVSIEAKSYTTLPALKPKFDTWQFIQNSALAGLVICILTGSFFALFKMNDGFLQFLLPLNVTAVGGFSYGFLTRRNHSHYVMGVVEQLSHYPANEQWLAFSKDSYQALNEESQRNLSLICRYRKIGILIVRSGGKVEILAKPKRQWRFVGNYLEAYCRQQEILATVR